MKEKLNKHIKLFEEMADKYAKGSSEHKRGLENYGIIELLVEVKAEAIDTIFYCDAAIKKLQKLKKEVSDETQEK